jgi:hypothetical protein
MKMGLGRWLAPSGLRVPRPTPDWDHLATSFARLVPAADVWRLFERAVSGLSVALCLHRVARTPTQSDRLSMSERDLDLFLEHATKVRQPSAAAPWLTLSFDDGYEDAFSYIETRARRFRSVEWLLLVCPEKVEVQAGFRWDLDGPDLPERDVRCENMRADLRAVVKADKNRLATPEQCRRLAALDNAFLGNHTNCHFRAADLAIEEASMEIRESDIAFRRLFGEARHFAFPFGTPEEDFDERHVNLLRERGDFLIWTTARRPYLAGHRRPGAVLPRFPVNGTWSAVQLAFWIAALSLRWRRRGLEPLYPSKLEGQFDEFLRVS